MAIDVFLRIPGIVGDSVVPGHEGDFRLISASFGFGRLINPSDGQFFGKTVPRTLRFTRLMDSSSVPLARLIALRTVISTATVFARPSESVDFWTATLTDALMESVDYGITAGGDPLRENFALSYRILRHEYKRFNANGTLKDSSRYTYTPVV